MTIYPPGDAGRLRTWKDTIEDPWFREVGFITDAITFNTHTFWHNRGALNIHLPVTTGTISSPMGLGSDSKPVRVSIDGKPTYLADSMQFYLEYGCRLMDRPCYYIMPSFRGEVSDRTHLNEFHHSEAEIEGTLDDVLVVVEEYLRNLASALRDNCAENLAQFGDSTVRRVDALADGGSNFARITFEQALDIIDASERQTINRMEIRGLTNEAEQQLIEREGPFVWVTHWDRLAVPFYQAFAGSDRTKASNADLLFGPGEVVGAGERHREASDLTAALDIHHVDAENYKWYIDMKQSSTVATSGFGMGVERFLMWLTGCSDIRDVQLVPRVGQSNVSW